MCSCLDQKSKLISLKKWEWDRSEKENNFVQLFITEQKHFTPFSVEDEGGLRLW